MNCFHPVNFPRRTWALPPARPICATITGCGSGKAEVSGVVLFNGQPLPFGTIQFLGPDGIPCSGRIQADGTYSVQAAVGEAKVIVSCVDEAQMTRLTTQQMSGQGRAAPLRTCPPRTSP